MRLPNRMKQERKLRRTTVRFGGLNRSEEARPGELSACGNLSSAQFPCLAPRKPRQSFANVTDAEDVYSRNGKLVLCRGGKLYYDGTPLCEVTPGKKQFVAVNSKLVVWPDKLLIDEITGSVRKMDAAVTSAGIDTEMTDHTIRMPNPPLVSGGVIKNTISPYNSMTGYWFRVYTGLKWDETNGYTWDSVEWKEIMEGNSLRVGDVLIPTGGDGSWQAQLHTSTSYRTPPSTATDELSAKGEYIVVSEISGGEISYGQNGRSFSVIVQYTPHRCDTVGQNFTDGFRVGDAVSVSGHPISRNNRKDLFLTDVTEDTLSFAEGSFIPCTKYAQMEIDTITEGRKPVVSKSGSRVYSFDWHLSGNSYEIKIKQGDATSYTPIKQGQTVLVDETGEKPKVWLMEADETLYELVFYDSEYYSGSHILLTPKSVYPLTLTVTRSVPDMDYICEKDNRLWGVVNHQQNRVWDKDAKKWVDYESRLIVASSLGMPDDFYDYTGAYSGAYAVAVASEGDFTGICSMDGDVLAWKEDRLYKVLGDYPANYQTAELHIPGVRSGAHRTLAARGGALVYLGRDGIYAYDGGSPRKISDSLGDMRFVSGAAAWDGECAVFSLRDDAGESSLLVYDAAHGLWLREDDATAVFCRHGESLLMLTREGELLQRDAGTEKVAWQARFVPLYTEFGERERGATLTLHAEIASGSELAAYYRCDGSAWYLAGRLSGTGVKTLRIEPKPFERLELRLTGTGACVVRGLSLLTRAERT